MSEYIVEFGYEPNVGNSSGIPIGERIVRCRDCEYQGNPRKCWLGETKPDEFCSRGKRKEVSE